MATGRTKPERRARKAWAKVDAISSEGLGAVVRTVDQAGGQPVHHRREAAAKLVRARPDHPRVMAAHEKNLDRAERATQRALMEIGREIRLARLNHDLSQRVAAAAAGISHTSWGRLERGQANRLPIPELARILAVVGMDLSVRAYPSGSPLRDRAHVALLKAFRALLGRDVRWHTEVAFPNAGDRRSWDGLAVVRSLRVGVEAETRARDAQELQRRLNGKLKDGAVDQVILLLADTRHNRAFLRVVGEGFRAGFPVSGPAALARLARSEDPGGNAIVLVSLPRA